MKTIKSNFTIFYPSDKIIYLFNEKPKNLGGTLLSDVIITFKDNLIEIVGNEHKWGFTFDKVNLKDLKEEVDEDYIVEKKSFGRIVKYVDGYYMKKGTSLFKAILTCYTIVQ